MWSCALVCWCVGVGVVGVACWFGLSRQQLPIVIPNLNRFYDLTQVQQPLGFMNLDY